MTQGLLDEMYWKPRVRDHADPQHLPLINAALPDPPSAKPPNEYGKRRRAMVAMLNGCDRVLAVSAFVRDKFVAMGVEPRVIEAMHIGTRIGRVLERNRELVFDPPPFDPSVPFDQQRPLRLIFMGYNNLYKGLHVFADALEMLTPEHLQRIDLSIFALDGKSIEWRFRRMEPRLAKLMFVHGYYFQDIPWMLGGKDLGVVPSVWWDNAPQTVFEFFSCGVPVLGAAVGGIPDFVKDNMNGLLFQGNNPWDLARRLVGAIREPWKLTAMRANVKPPKEMDDHVLELEPIYRGDAADR
jgi:glycosyltransferase involved in cell wall biosynthesis